MNQIQAEHSGLDEMLDITTQVAVVPSLGPGVWKGTFEG